MIYPASHLIDFIISADRVAAGARWEREPPDRLLRFESMRLVCTDKATGCVIITPYGQETLASRDLWLQRAGMVLDRQGLRQCPAGAP